MVPQHLAPIACPLCSRALTACQCGTTPAAPAPAPAPKPVARTFVKMGAYMICQRCDMAVQYCRCGELTTADASPEDGPAAASLAQRIKDCTF